MVEIKFCENNSSFGTEAVAKKLSETYKQITVDVEPCLGFCGDCASGPYALVDDELIQADSADDLLEAIVEIIEQSPA